MPILPQAVEGVSASIRQMLTYIRQNTEYGTVNELLVLKFSQFGKI